MAESTFTFHVEINAGPEQTVTVRTSQYALAAVAALALLEADFAYSKRMHQEKTVKPAQRKARKAMAAALACIGALAFLALNGYVLHWF